jgi:hypothetical protein
MHDIELGTASCLPDDVVAGICTEVLARLTCELFGMAEPAEGAKP